MIINFNNLSTEGYATFILAIIFSIVAFAGFIFLLRHKELNKVLLILITLVAPFIAVFCWTYLLFSIFGTFTSLVSFGVAIAVAAGYVLVAIAIAMLIELCLKNRTPREKKKKKDKKKKKNQEDEEKPSEEKVEEKEQPIRLLTMNRSKQIAMEETVETNESQIIEESKDEE